eukprot:365321-Chlamydomonas_euryale.AAC.25
MRRHARQPGQWRVAGGLLSARACQAAIAQLLGGQGMLDSCMGYHPHCCSPQENPSDPWTTHTHMHARTHTHTVGAAQ